MYSTKLLLRLLAMFKFFYPSKCSSVFGFQMFCKRRTSVHDHSCTLMFRILHCFVIKMDYVKSFSRSFACSCRYGQLLSMCYSKCTGNRIPNGERERESVTFSCIIIAHINSIEKFTCPNLIVSTAYTEPTGRFYANINSKGKRFMHSRWK